MRLANEMRAARMRSEQIRLTKKERTVIREALELWRWRTDGGGFPAKLAASITRKLEEPCR